MDSHLEIHKGCIHLCPSSYTRSFTWKIWKHVFVFYRPKFNFLNKTNIKRPHNWLKSANTYQKWANISYDSYWNKDSKIHLTDVVRCKNFIEHFNKKGMFQALKRMPVLTSACHIFILVDLRAKLQTFVRTILVFSKWACLAVTLAQVLLKILIWASKHMLLQVWCTFVWFTCQCIMVYCKDTPKI